MSSSCCPINPQSSLLSRTSLMFWSINREWKMFIAASNIVQLMKRNWLNCFELLHASVKMKEILSTTGTIYKLNNCHENKLLPVEKLSSKSPRVFCSRQGSLRCCLTLTLIILSGFWQQSAIINNGCYAFDIGKYS